MTEENLANNQKWRGRIFRYAPLLVWIGIIFFASTSNGSMAQTSRFVRPLLEFLFPNSPEETLQTYHSYIRKIGHFTGYAILAFWACRAFSNSTKSFLRKYWFAAPFLLVLLVASIDETNQSFNALRTGSAWDVLLDCTGGATMILIFYVIKNLPRKRNVSKIK